MGNETSLSRYQKAQSFLPWMLVGQVRNVDVVPHWFDGGRKFYYRRQLVEGCEFVVVDAEAGKKYPLFDHTVLSERIGEPGSGLSIDHLHYDHESRLIEFTHKDDRYRYSIETTDLEKVIYFQDYVVTDPGQSPLKPKQLLNAGAASS